jgi:signal peptidase I
VKWLKRIVFILVPLLLVAGLGVFASGALPYKVYVVHTGSMSPTISPKTVVIVREHQYHVDQVVTFVENGQTVTHRLVSIDPDGMITTKGDANATADPWHVPQSQIVGGVVKTMPEVGYWLVYLKHPYGLASVVLAMLVIWQIWALGSTVSGEPASAERSIRPGPRRRHSRGRHVRVST